MRAFPTPAMEMSALVIASHPPSIWPSLTAGLPGAGAFQDCWPAEIAGKQHPQNHQKSRGWSPSQACRPPEAPSPLFWAWEEGESWPGVLRFAPIPARWPLAAPRRFEPPVFIHPVPLPRSPTSCSPLAFPSLLPDSFGGKIAFFLQPTDSGLRGKHENVPPC